MLYCFGMLLQHEHRVHEVAGSSCDHGTAAAPAAGMAGAAVRLCASSSMWDSWQLEIIAGKLARRCSRDGARQWAQLVVYSAAFAAG